MQHTSRFLHLTETIRKTIQEISITDLKKKLDNHQSFYLVDVREDSEWAQGHIPNAIHLGKGVIERDIEKTIPKTDAEIVLYCGGGYRSAIAAESLQKMGYTNVLSLNGGIKGWLQSGYSLQ